MTGDAVRQLLAEIQQRAEASSEAVAAEGDMARSWVAATASADDVYPLLAAVTAVFDVHAPFDSERFPGEVYCRGCSDSASHPCETYRVVAAALQEQP